MPDANLSIHTRLPGVGGDPFGRADLLGRPVQLLDSTRLGNLSGLRIGLVEQLLRRHPTLLEADPRGAPALRRQLLAWSPSGAALDAAHNAGLRVLREQHLEGLDERMLTFSVPDTVDAAQLLERLRKLDPEGAYDFNHVYQGGAVQEGIGQVSGASSSAPLAPGSAGNKANVAIGLVDSGVDPAHPVFAAVRMERWGCGGAAHPSVHGNAVAALMAGSSAHFSGVLPGARLYAADVYCGSPGGGAADTIAGALNWMALQKVPVVNLSIVGPDNRTLARAVAALLRRGHVLVAAVGNDGPAAAPLYPASYPGVVGVSAVDKHGRVLPEAARGPQVKFAAPGHDMVSAAVGAPPYRRVRGTSFAAPIVAALLAPGLRTPDPGAAAAAIAALARLAGTPTPHPETGHGIVGMDYRVDPASLRRDD